MRYILLFVGAAVVAYFLTLGIRTWKAERRVKSVDHNERSGVE